MMANNHIGSKEWTELKEKLVWPQGQIPWCENGATSGGIGTVVRARVASVGQGEHINEANLFGSAIKWSYFRSEVGLIWNFGSDPTMADGGVNKVL